MRMSLIGMVALGAANLAHAQNQDPRLFTFEAERYSEEAVICQNTADRLAERLAQEFEITVVDAQCVQNTAESFDLQIDYYSVSRLPLVSTAKPAGGNLDNPGRFEERADCEAALPGEKDLFEASTGLAADLFYCFQDSIMTGGKWMTKVEAFGESEVVPQMASTYVFSQVQGFSRATFVEGIKANALAFGISVSDVLIRPSLGYMTVTMLFYGPGRQRIENTEIVKMAKAEQCEEQLAETREMLSDSSLLLGFCTYERITGAHEINTLGYNYLPAECYVPANVYGTYEECRADRQAVEDRFRDRLPKPVLGVLCGIDEDQWKAHVVMAND